MPRPVKSRRIEKFPKNDYFIPLGKKKCQVKEFNIKIEELEAMRLKDIEGLTQEECAKKMQISRQTFQNIIDNARKKVTMALTSGGAIHITGGNYTTKLCQFRCASCGNLYSIDYERDKEICPVCGSKEVWCDKKNIVCKKWCRYERDEM